MQRVAIVFHSTYGNTEKQAAAVELGALSVRGTQVTRLSVEGASDHYAELQAADAIVFGAPTYMGSLSAPFKAFMEDTARRIWQKQEWRDKLAAGFTCSAWPSGDKLQSLVQLSLFAAQHGMVWLGLDVLASEGEGANNRLGSWLGAMARGPSDGTGPSAGDLLAAARLGERTATWAMRIRAQNVILTESAERLAAP